MAHLAEKRKDRRYELSVPVEVWRERVEAPQIGATSRDISARGIYLTLPKEIDVGSDVEFELSLPPELCQGNIVRVHCRGKVVRIERKDPQGRIGVAATIEEFSFLRNS